MKDMKNETEKKKINSYVLILTFAIVLTFGFSSQSIQISNIEFDLKGNPGSTSTHEFVVTNDESDPVNVKINVGDWYRNPQGANRFIDRNAARWRAPRLTLAEGEKLTIKYKAQVPNDFTGKFSVEGAVTVSRPDSELKVYGDRGYDVETSQLSSRTDGQEGPVSAKRKIIPLSEGTLEISVKIVANKDIRGLTLSEEFPVNTKVTNLESGDIPIEYVNRSAADWIDVDTNEFTLEPKEKREIQFSISTPPNVEGTHWATIYVRSEPLTAEREGTTIVAIKRFAIKIYQTITGTTRKKAFVTEFSSVTRTIPKFNLKVKNEGNVQLEFKGELRLRDETGEVVDTIDINSFPLLPGYERQITLKGEEITKLSAGKYNAVVVLDYGGENRIGKTVSFQVEPLNLRPIGGSFSTPKDLDGDGLYEDINGDGKLDQTDAIKFSFNYDSAAVQENARAFDFNLDGLVNMADGNELNRMAEEGS